MTTQYTFDSDLISDLYKDAHGFRPSEYYFDRWDQASDDEKQEMWDYLCHVAADKAESERRYEEQAMAEFDAAINTAINSGAKDRATAVRWMVEAWCPGDDVVAYDLDRFCYDHGLPYGMMGTIADLLEAAR